MNQTNKPRIELPDAFVQAVTSQRVVLFLGAGSSLEAVAAGGLRPPTAAIMRDALAQKFFGKPMPDYDLASLSELAIQAHGQALVFEQIKNILEPFEPSPAHQLLPAFRWRAIATTNYDLLVDKAYGLDRNRLQTLVPFVKDREPIEDRMQRVSAPLQFLKLHGCLNHLHDTQIPLILSHEHYSQHLRHRRQLYHRLEGWAHESTFVFCGYRLGDAHIRKIIYDLADDAVKRPAYYLVAPGVAAHDATFWSTHNVHLVDATFGQLMASLDAAIPKAHRILTVSTGELPTPIARHFKTHEPISERLRQALMGDIRHIHPQMPIETQDAKRFYEGFDTGFGAIAQRLDVQRKLVEDLLIDAVLDAPAGNEPQIFVLSGAAGSGKSIALKRAAWEAAADYDALVLWLNDTGFINIDIPAELHRLSGKRIYLFVDRLAQHVDAIEALYTAAKIKQLPLTIVGSERLNEWNVYCNNLESIAAPIELAIANLTIPEIEGLIDLLTRHKALGFLTGQPRDAQINAFSERAERQLLVALHEVTHGKPFEAIVLDEYRSIVPEQAQRLYLDICTLHQFSIPARAGTISRISGIRFDAFQRDFFAPLENIVLTGRDPRTQDMHYRARHSRVAELVFQQACPTVHERTDQLVRIIAELDIGYSVDRTALEKICRARSLAGLLSTAEGGRSVFTAALAVAPDASWLIHQWAVFELNHEQGSLEEADRLARLAASHDSRSKSIKHTQAEICRRRANDATSPLLKEQFRRLARERLDEARADNDRYILSARCKIAVDEIDELARGLDDPPNEAQQTFFRDKVRDTERLMVRARQLYPEDAEVHLVESRLGKALQQEARAVRALERAWDAVPRGSGVAIRLAHHYTDQKDHERTLSVLRVALERNPDDRPAHLEMAKHLIIHDPDKSDLIAQHLTRSYAINDHNHEARHLHAQHLFQIGKAIEAKALFDTINISAPIDFRQKTPTKDSIVSSRLNRFTGVIATLKATMIFVKCAAYSADIFGHTSQTSGEVWRTLKAGDSVTFKIRFNRSGPVAVDIRHAGQ